MNLNTCAWIFETAQIIAVQEQMPLRRLFPKMALFVAIRRKPAETEKNRVQTVPRPWMVATPKTALFLITIDITSVFSLKNVCKNWCRVGRRSFVGRLNQHSIGFSRRNFPFVVLFVGRGTNLCNWMIRFELVLPAPTKRVCAQCAQSLRSNQDLSSWTKRS